MQSMDLQLTVPTQIFYCSWSWQVLTLQHIQGLSEEAVSWSETHAMDPTGWRAGIITWQSDRAQVYSLLTLPAQKQQVNFVSCQKKTLELSVLPILCRRIEIE